MHRNTPPAPPPPKKIVQFCDDPPPKQKKISTKSSYPPPPPPPIFLSENPKNIEIQNFEPPKMGQAYYIYNARLYENITVLIGARLSHIRSLFMFFHKTGSPKLNKSCSNLLTFCKVYLQYVHDCLPYGNHTTIANRVWPKNRYMTITCTICKDNVSEYQ